MYKQLPKLVCREKFALYFCPEPMFTAKQEQSKRKAINTFLSQLLLTIWQYLDGYQCYRTASAFNPFAV